MKIILALTLTLLTTTAWASMEVEKERVFDRWESEILLGGSFHCQKESPLPCSEQQGLFLTVLERLDADGHTKTVDAAMQDLAQQKDLAITTTVRMVDLLRKQRPGSSLLRSLTARVHSTLRLKKPKTVQEKTTLCHLWSQSFCTAADKVRIEFPSQKAVTDLYHTPADLSHYRNGRYENQPKLFMFCRKDRRYPCLTLAKDRYGRPVLDSKGKLWKLPTLGLSRHGKKYNQFNGNTPAGIFTIDGVMPSANKQLVFGKFRRMILEFVPESQDESIQKSFLPASSHTESWWYEGVVARNIGRGLFRIHGTGLRNFDESNPYYTFYATSGCIATRENFYDGIDYKDQRHFLDQMMDSANLDPIYKNETKIRGVIFVININDKKSAVQMADLAAYNIIE